MLARAKRAAGKVKRFTQVLWQQGVRAAVGKTLRYLLLRVDRERSHRLAQVEAESRALADRCQQLVNQLEAFGTRAQVEAAEGVAWRTATQQQIAAIPKTAPIDPHLAHRVHLLSQSVEWLAEQLGQASAKRMPDVPSQPLVSVILPTWNRAKTIHRAIESVQAQTYTNWELIVVDDGSCDSTEQLLSDSIACDSRIRLVRQDHQGVSVARNAGLAMSQGEILAYIDSDNRWYPGYLAAVVETLTENSSVHSVYAGQLVRDQLQAVSHIRYQEFDDEALHFGNYIDMNCFAHRRWLYEERGGFDEQLTRLVDWEFILRLTRNAPPQAIAQLGSCYEHHAGHDRISLREPTGQSYYRIRKKFPSQLSVQPRVLYALWHFPQVTESYVRWELEWMRQQGVHVEVWSELEYSAAPFPTDVPIHFGSLDEAIEKANPDVMHCHWLHSGQSYGEAAARHGVPVTVRAHGFEVSAERLQALQQSHDIRSIYVFPHMTGLVGPDKIRPMNISFNGELFYPEEKDRRLVVRTGAGLLTKDYESFFRCAQLCPNHRFVLVIAACNQCETQIDEIAELNRQFGGHAEIRLHLDAEEVSALMRRAGTFLHTFGFRAPIGMPISICEAMATGAHVLVRRHPTFADYVAHAGTLYDSPEEAAAIIQQSATWADSQWEEVQTAAVERAYTQFADEVVLRPMLQDWVAAARGNLSRGYRFDTKRSVDLMKSFGMDAAGHFNSSLLGHGLRIFRCLDAWGADEPVCQAGLFHSAYGTESTRGFALSLDRRDEVRAVLGARAESLAYLNCAMKRPSFEAAVAQGDRNVYTIADRFTGLDVVLSRRDFDDLCRVHLADGLEQHPRMGRLDERLETFVMLAQRLGGPAQAEFERLYDMKLPSERQAIEIRKAA